VVDVLPSDVMRSGGAACQRAPTEPDDGRTSRRGRMCAHVSNVLAPPRVLVSRTRCG